MTPDELGFLLKPVQVHDVQDVWAVMRDQRWLNDTLSKIS
jgi:hypothetical protein